MIPKVTYKEESEGIEITLEGTPVALNIAVKLPVMMTVNGRVSSLGFFPDMEAAQQAARLMVGIVRTPEGAFVQRGSRPPVGEHSDDT